MLIYPAIDLRAGECVRLLHGRFDAVTRYDGDPLSRLAAFEAAGAQWVHVVDLDGAEAGEPRQHNLIARMAATTRVRIQAGGGVRKEEDVDRLLNAGAARVVIGSLSVRRPDTVIEWLDRFGSDRLTLALDVRMIEGVPMMATDGWTRGSGRSLWEGLRRLAAGRPRHILVTEISRDGALEGPDLSLAAAIATRQPHLHYQASGGVASLADLVALKAAGATGAVVGRALYERRFSLEEALRAG